MSSILNDTKKLLGIAADYDVFDQDVIIHVNSALYTLSQLGLGPPKGLTIKDEQNQWDEFVSDDDDLSGIKSYVFIRVKLMFDPPANSFLVTSLNEQRQELEWRLNVSREEEVWNQERLSPRIF